MKDHIIAAASFIFLTAGITGCQPVKQVTVQQPTPTQQTSNTETQETKETTQTPGGREQFGSLTSPDGKWLLTEEKLEGQAVVDGKKVTSVQHELSLDGLQGQGDKKILTIKETYDITNELPDMNTGWDGKDLNGKRFASEWTPAGWSADGTKVYFATQPYVDGLGGWYPMSNIHWFDIHEIDVASGEEKVVFNPKKGFILTGVADFMATKQLALSYDKEQKGTIELSDLKNDKTTTVWDPDQQVNISYNGVASAIFSPDGTQIAVVTYENTDGPTDTRGTLRTYALWIVEKTGADEQGNDIYSYTGIDVATTDEWEMLNWVDDQTIKIHIYSATGEEEKEVKIN